MHITNINQLLPFVAQKPEFVVLKRDGYQVIDYVYQNQSTFDAPELMECRGIKFCPDGLILARPFRKFFNYGQFGGGLPAHRIHTITTKLDGSMIHPILLERRLYFHARQGYTNVAKRAEQYVLSTPEINYQGFCLKMIKDGWTPIFEYTGPDNRIVLRYEEEGLTLLAMRHTVEGTVRSLDSLIDDAEEFNIPLVHEPAGIEGNLICDAEGFVQATRALKDSAGHVVYFDDGYMVKVKAKDYVLKHRMPDGLGNKKNVIALCAQGFIDEVLPFLNETEVQELLEFNEALRAEVTKLARAATGLADIVVSGSYDRKYFAKEWAPKIVPRWLVGVCFGIMDGKDARMLVLKAVEKHYNDIGVKWRSE